MPKPKMVIEGPKGKTEAIDSDFQEMSAPWTELLVERAGKKAIRVRIKLVVTHVFTTDEKTPTGEPLLSISTQNIVKAEELDDAIPSVSR